MGRHAAVHGAWSLAAAGFGLLVACAGGNDVARGVVTDSAGVRIVTGPADDIPLPWRLAHQHTVTLPDSGVTPAPWMIASDATTGHAFIIDRAASRIHVADTAGAIVTSWGRSGRGPHEMASPVAIDVASDGSVVVVDALRQLLIRWTAEGEPIDEIALPVPYWGPGFATLDNATVLIRSVPDPEEPLQLGQELVHARADTVQVLASLPQNMTLAELPCMRRPIPKAFAASILWTASDSRIYNIVWPHYRIDVHDGKAWVASVRRDIPPIQVSDSMAIREIETGQLRTLLRMCGIDAPSLLREIGSEPHASPVTWLAVDGADQLWVWRSFAGRQQVDVFAAEGVYLGTAQDVPMPVAFLSSSRFLAVRDPFEDAVLELWSIER